MRKLVAVLPFVVIAGCGANLGEPEAPTSSQMQANTQLNNSSKDLVALKAEGGEGKVFQLQGMLAGIGPTATKPKASVGGIGFPLGSPGDLSPSLEPSGCVTGSAAAGWTYNACKEGDTTINGSTSIAGDQIKMDLTITSTSQTSFTIKMKGDITVTATSIDGWLEYDVSASVGLASAGFNTKVTYTGVTFASGCITGGAVLVDYSGSGITGTAQFEYTGCNTFQVRNAT